MTLEVEAILSCNECPMAVRRREKDLDDPEVASTDSLIWKHKLHTGHSSFSLDVREVAEMTVYTVEVDTWSH